MRNLFSIVVLAAAVGCAQRTADTPHESAVEPEQIFREVRFGLFQPLSLDRPIPRGAPPARLVAPGLFALYPLAFGGADSIYVQVGADQRVTGLFFVYPATERFSPSVAEYAESLGQPRLVIADSAGGRLQRAIWEDSATVFEYSELAVGGTRRRMWSLLRDRASGR